ncbi:type IV secretion system protein [Rhodanobacter hydrolyticus]|uniref:Type IV secretion system protein n=1 Tax=Rhodanobacter hydrolyticus TaxID=2250595 RepID=A0ABW8J5I0_9GAMM
MNLAIYILVYNYINTAINNFMTHLMKQTMEVVSAAALLVLTAWVMSVGYRVITGTLREPLMAVVTNMARIVIIVTIATSMSIFGSNLHDLATNEIPTDLNQMFTGNSNTIQQSINDNLAQTVAAMAAIDAVQAAPGDMQTISDKARAADFAIFGTASPPMAVGAMLLLYNFAIALFVGLGPLFILCLIFNKTKALFEKWLMYGLATLFSLAMLSFVSAIVLQVTLRAATALWASNFVNNLLQTSSEGLSTQSLEQGGIGLLMTMLIISVPPMAGNFFQTTLGSFMAYSAFNGAASRPGPQGQPPGAYGYGGHGPVQAGANRVAADSRTASGYSASLGPTSSASGARLGSSSYMPRADVTKQGGGLANPPTPG